MKNFKGVYKNRLKGGLCQCADLRGALQKRWGGIFEGKG